MLKRKIFNTVPFCLLLLCCRLHSTSTTNQGLSEGDCHISPSYFQWPSSGCPRCPSTAGSTHVGLTSSKFTSPAVYTTFPCTLTYRDTEVLNWGSLFVRQGTISRTVLPLLWQTSISGILIVMLLSFLFKWPARYFPFKLVLPGNLIPWVMWNLLGMYQIGIFCSQAAIERGLYFTASCLIQLSPGDIQLEWNIDILPSEATCFMIKKRFFSASKMIINFICCNFSVLSFMTF